MMRIQLMMICGFLTGAPAFAATLIEKSVEVSTKEKNPSVARRLLIDQAQVKVIEEMVLQTIGAERFSKSKGVIQSKIVKNSSRMIPFTNAGNLEAEGEGFRLRVLLKINPDELDQLLLQNGLFYESDVQPALLPLVAWSDEIEEEKGGWWTPNAKHFLIPSMQEFETVLQSQFLKSGFLVLRPSLFGAKNALSTSVSSPPSYTELQALANSRGIQVVIPGEVRLRKHGQKSGAFEIEIRLSALHVPRNRVLAQTVRRFETEPGPMIPVVEARLREAFEVVSNDLSGQTLEAWRRGSVLSNVYKITVQGGLTPAQQEAFMESFRQTIREVKTMRERWISAQGVTFEIDSIVTPKDLAKRGSEFTVSGAKLVLKDVTDTELRYQVLGAR